MILRKVAKGGVVKGKRGLAHSNCLHDPQLALEDPAKKDKSYRNHIYRTNEIISSDTT